MRTLRIVCLLLLAAPPAAHAGETAIVSRDVPLAGARSVAAVAPVRAFDMVGLHWQGRGTVRFRTRSTGGTWSPWRVAAPEPEDRPDVGAERSRRGWQLGNPWWTGRSDRLELRTTGTVTRVRAWYVSSSAARIPLRRVSMAQSPALTPRRGWQANEQLVRTAPRYAPTLRFAVVHHTAGSNAYRPEESAAIVKGIQLYHVKANGWNDIGYNFLVDKYGQVFEGRGGGIDRNVIGAHAEGFNTGSVGVALIGMYTSAAPTKEAERALAALLSWRLDVAHADPATSSLITSGGSSRFRPGAGVYLRTISGHRDTGFTSCPGDSLYARLGALTEVAATTGLPKLYEPAARGRVGATVRFSGRLSQPLRWTVTVSGPGGTRVAGKSGTGDRISWDWNSAGVPAGRRYVWRMEASGVRPASGVVGGGGITPPPTPPAPPASGLSVAPAVVSPNGDGYQDVATVRYTLPEPATVSVSLEDAAGLTVSMPVIGAAQKAGTRTVRLDALLLPDGTYRVAVEAQGRSGRKTRLVDDLTVNRTLGWLRADPSALSPDGDGVGDVMTISFELTTAAQVTVEVRSNGNQLGIVFTEWLEAGSHGVLWQGRLPQGVVPPGSYEIWVTAGNEVGIVAQRVPVVVTSPAR